MSDKECILDCPNCKHFEQCDTEYYFVDGTCVAEPQDRDEYGNIMDEAWYRNMENYGVPYVPEWA